MARTRTGYGRDDRCDGVRNGAGGDRRGADGGTAGDQTGSYVIAEPLIYYANTELRGVRGASIIRNDSGRSSYIMLVPDAGSTVEQVVIDGLTFDQRSDLFGFTPRDQLLSINQVSGITIRHCTFLNVITVAIWADTRGADATTQHVRIEDCWIQNSVSGGIGLFGGVQDLVIAGNRIEHCQDDAIALQDLSTGERPANAVITHNTILNCDTRNSSGSTPHAIMVYGGENVTITDNLIDGTVASAITAQYGTSHSNHVIIAHNIVRNAGVTADDVTGVPGHGIMALTSDNIQILNNIVVGSRQWGIAAAAIDWLTVAHNRVENNTGGTISIATSTNVTNLFNGEATPALAGGLHLSGASVGSLEMRNLTIANNATAQLTVVAAYQQAMGIAFVVSIEDGSVAIFSLTGGNGVTFEISDPQNQFSNAAGTAGSTNVYNEGAPNWVYRIENKRGDARNYCVFLFVNRQ